MDSHSCVPLLPSHCRQSKQLHVLMMLPWIDVFCSGFAILSTIVATLRAGSRVLYISEHQMIGVMKGPMILPPSGTNETEIVFSSNSSGEDENKNTTKNRDYELYELSENFKHCVRLSNRPSLYQNVQVHVPVDSTAKERRYRRDVFEHQPYTLGASTYKPAKFRSQSTTMTLEEGKDEEEEKESFIDSELDHSMSRQESESSPDQNHKDIRRGILWGKSFWWWKQRPTIEETTTTLEMQSNWDYGHAIEADFFYNPSTSLPPPVGNHNGDVDTYNYRRRLAQLTVFCPKVFENLRSIFGISELQYLQSILNSGPFVSFQSNSKGAARVGGSFSLHETVPI